MKNECSFCEDCELYGLLGDEFPSRVCAHPEIEDGWSVNPVPSDKNKNNDCPDKE